MKSGRERLVIIVLFCLALLPVIILRDFTPSNELRYLSIADEALRNHTFFAFTNHGAPYPDKPPLYLWLIMLCRWLTGGHHLWLLSLLSFIPAIGIVMVINKWVITEMSSNSRTLAMLMTLTSGLFLVSAITIRMDMLMCLFITLSLREFWTLLTMSGDVRRAHWLFPVFIFLGIFTKGALALAIPLVSTAIFCTLSDFAGATLGLRVRRFCKIWNWQVWGVLFICVGTWFAATYIEGGADFIRNMLFKQTLGRAFHAFHHNAPFYYYLIHFWYCLAPWALVVVCAIIVALRPTTIRSNLQCFFLVIALTTFGLLSCISGKLQIYMLPAVPFFIYSGVMFLPRVRHYHSLLCVSLALPAIIFIMALPAVIIVCLCVGMSCLDNAMVYVASGILSLCGIQTLRSLHNRRYEYFDNAVRCMGYGVLLTLFVAAWALPSINKQIGYGFLCRKALMLSNKYDIKDFRTWRLHRSAGIDVYMRHSVAEIAKDSLPIAKNDSAFILLTKECELKNVAYTEKIDAKPYAAVVIGRK